MCTRWYADVRPRGAHAYEGGIPVVHPPLIKELVEFLRRAAAGDESTCPAVLDLLWHRWLEFPKAYEAFCRRNFGVVIEHVTNDGGPCKARVKVQ
jgi:hypothetical protein